MAQKSHQILIRHACVKRNHRHNRGWFNESIESQVCCPPINNDRVFMKTAVVMSVLSINPMWARMLRVMLLVMRLIYFLPRSK